MKKFLMLITVLSVWIKCGIGENNNDFTKIREEDGILLFSRWVPAPGNRETREIRASFEVEAEPSGILGLLRNE